MAYIERMKNYVKFIRGTAAAWDSLAVKDSDTLYFIASEDKTRWQLYLGDRLISNGNVNDTITVKDLSDIVLSKDGILNNSLLVYDSEQKVWVDKPIGDILNLIVKTMTGATEEADGAVGLVPAPKKGEQGLFLRGDGLWADPSSEVDARLTEVLNVLYGEDTDQTKSISDIASTLIKDVVGTAPDTLDTLEEIAQWIAEHEDAIDLANIKQDIENLNTIIYGTEDTVDGEEIVSGEKGLVDKVETLENNYNTINETIETLDQRMRWCDLELSE